MKVHNVLLSPVVVIFAVVVVLLIFVTVGQRVLQWVYPRHNWNELKGKITTWWKIVIVFFLSLLAGHQVFLVLWTLISFLAFKEYLSLISPRHEDRRVLFFAYMAIPLQYYFVFIRWYGVFIILIPVYVFLFLPFCMILLGRVRGFVQSVGSLHWGLMLTTFCISHAAYLLALPDIGGTWFDGKTLLLYLLILTQCNDLIQYVTSKGLGGPKIVPHISKTKTWPGFAAGMTATILISLGIAHYLTPLSMVGAVLVAILLSITGLVGHLIVSVVERDMGVDEASVASRGSVLGRLDSLTYTSPLFFHTMYYFFY